MWLFSITKNNLFFFFLTWKKQLVKYLLWMWIPLVKFKGAWRSLVRWWACLRLFELIFSNHEIGKVERMCTSEVTFAPPLTTLFSAFPSLFLFYCVFPSDFHRFFLFFSFNSNLLYLHKELRFYTTSGIKSMYRSYSLIFFIIFRINMTK